MQCEKFYHFAASPLIKISVKTFMVKKKNNDDFAEVSIFCENTRE